MAALFVLCAALAVRAAIPKTKPYHLELVSSPASAFPFLAKFGTITIHVYPSGVRAESFWLNGFSRTGAPALTIMNPVMRMYSDVPVEELPSVVSKFAVGNEMENIGPDYVEKPVPGKVGPLNAKRYRLVYLPSAYMDFWMTDAVPENPQLRAMVDGLISGISKPTARALRAIPGTPVYVELNFRRYKKIRILTFKNLAYDRSGEQDALTLGHYYFKAPLLDAIWK